MKIPVFIFCLLMINTFAFAEGESKLFTCKGKKTPEGFLPLFNVVEDKGGKWISYLTAENVISEANDPEIEVKILSQEKNDDGCVVKIQQASGAKEKAELVYKDKELIYRGRANSNFAEAKCNIFSKKFRDKLNACGEKKVEANEKLYEAISCKSGTTDELGYSRIRIDLNKDGDYSERRYFKYSFTINENGEKEKKPEPYPPMAINIKSSWETEDQKRCILKIQQSWQDPAEDPIQRIVFSMVIRAPMPFPEDGLINLEDASDRGVPGTVDQLGAKKEGEDDTKRPFRLPTPQKNMKCQLSKSFVKKLKNCDIDIQSKERNSSSAKKKEADANKAAQ